MVDVLDGLEIKETAASTAVTAPEANTPEEGLKLPGGATADVVLEAGRASESTKATEVQPPVSFLRAKEEKEPRLGVLTRVLLGALLALLLLVLVGQAAHHWRDRWVAQFPPVKPWAQWACSYLGCKLSAPTVIESIVIESSNFNRVRSNLYRLSVTLRNTSSLELTLPALELSLTDSQEQVVMRRVLVADELYANGQRTLGASTEWSGQIPIQIQLQPGADRFSGFKLVAFYP